MQTYQITYSKETGHLATRLIRATGPRKAVSILYWAIGKTAGRKIINVQKVS
jgi:hypothetical protein